MAVIIRIMHLIKKPSITSELITSKPITKPINGRPVACAIDTLVVPVGEERWVVRFLLIFLRKE